MTSINNPGHIALANNNLSTNYRQVINFHGYEGEDFRYFLDLLESYFAFNNVPHEIRKLTILKTQLKGPAKTFFDKEILQKYTDIKYDQVIEELKNHYITPELIQKYEMEFNDMYQGNQEHPQVFLSRLYQAADLANIKDEGVIESRFRAGLLKEIKLFCIQSSSRTMKDWITHAEGWWNANRPRKIAMVDNPFIPRNVDQALTYHNETPHQTYYGHNNQHIELGDSNEHVMSALTMNNGQQLVNANQQQDLIQLIQQTIRNELNNQQNNQFTRNYNRSNRNNYNDGYNRYNRNNGNNFRSYNNDVQNQPKDNDQQPLQQQKPSKN